MAAVGVQARSSDGFVTFSNFLRPANICVTQVAIFMNSLHLPHGPPKEKDKPLAVGMPSMTMALSTIVTLTQNHPVPELIQYLQSTYTSLTVPQAIVDVTIARTTEKSLASICFAQLPILGEMDALALKHLLNILRPFGLRSSLHEHHIKGQSVLTWCAEHAGWMIEIILNLPAEYGMDTLLALECRSVLKKFLKNYARSQSGWLILYKLIRRMDFKVLNEFTDTFPILVAMHCSTYLMGIILDAGVDLDGCRMDLFDSRMFDFLYSSYQRPVPVVNDEYEETCRHFLDCMNCIRRKQQQVLTWCECLSLLFKQTLKQHLHQIPVLWRIVQDYAIHPNVLRHVL